MGCGTKSPRDMRINTLSLIGSCLDANSARGLTVIFHKWRVSLMHIEGRGQGPWFLVPSGPHLPLLNRFQTAKTLTKQFLIRTKLREQREHLGSGTRHPFIDFISSSWQCFEGVCGVHRYLSRSGRVWDSAHANLCMHFGPDWMCRVVSIFVRNASHVPCSMT